MSFLISCPTEQSHTAPVLSVEAVKIILGEEEGGREGGREGGGKEGVRAKGEKEGRRERGRKTAGREEGMEG